MMVRKTIFLVIFLMFSSIFTRGQDSIPLVNKPEGYFGPTRTTIKLDPFTRIPIGDLPFDRDFFVRMYFNKDADIPRIFLQRCCKGKICEEAYEVGYFGISPDNEPSTDKDLYLKSFKAIDIFVPAKGPKDKYYFIELIPISTERRKQYFDFFKNHHKKGSEDDSREYFKRINDKTFDLRPTFDQLLIYYDQKNLKNIFDINSELEAERIISELLKNEGYITEGAKKTEIFYLSKLPNYCDKDSINNYGSILTTLDKSSQSHLIADAGLSFVLFPNSNIQVSPYVGVNYSFRPFDSDIPFKRLNVKPWERLTLNVGITLYSLAKENERGNLFGNNNLLLGMGYKFSHVVNFNAGAAIFNTLNPNPLIDEKTLGVVPYVGGSINLRISKALGDIAKVFTYGK